MKRKRFAEEQIIAILREHEAGVAMANLCHKHRMSSASLILSGGSGTRLWPLSRSMYPKQFIRFFNGQGKSFLGATSPSTAPHMTTAIASHISGSTCAEDARTASGSLG